MDSCTQEKYRADWQVDEGLWLVLALCGALAPFGLDLTDDLYVSFWPIHIILGLYLGFRMGRWWALAGGACMMLPWIITLMVVGEDVLGDGVELLGQYIDIRIVTIDDVIIVTAISWASGWIFDLIEKHMAENQVYLAEMFPRRRKALISSCFEAVHSLFFKWEKDDKSDLTSLERFSDKLRSFWLRVKQLAILPVIFVVLNVAIFLDAYLISDIFYELEVEEWAFHIVIWPIGSLLVVLCAIAFLSATRLTVIALFIMWLECFLLVVSEDGPWNELMVEEFRATFTVISFVSLLGISMITLVFSKFGKLWKNTEFQEAAIKLFQPYRRSAQNTLAASLTIVLPLCLLLLTLTFEPSFFR